MNKPVIHIADYTYNLPDERIAKYPLENRDASKLLIYRNDNISHTIFSDLPEILPENSLLIFNNSKVIRARLKFRKETGATIEIFCLEPVDPVDVQLAFETTKSVQWKCIPPYLNRKSEEIDNKRYQTVYSKHKGSVIQNITLHVGAGTFKPVQSETIADHEMHTEHFVVEASVVKEILKKKEKLVAVGTTSVRTIESLYWLGVRLLEETDIREGISQWDPYNLPDDHSPAEALNALLRYMSENNLTYFNSKTAIIIVPGYRFRLVKTLITNFHQPKSTLLLLIGAFIGDNWKKVYDYALKNDFRFLSYGDSSILFSE